MIADVLAKIATLGKLGSDTRDDFETVRYDRASPHLRSWKWLTLQLSSAIQGSTRKFRDLGVQSAIGPTIPRYLDEGSVNREVKKSSWHS